MTSERKKQANRENARRSTGPRDTSRTSQNALKHGALAKIAVLATENQDAFEELFQGLRKAFAPVGDAEELLVQMLAQALWRMQRLVKYETEGIDRSIRISTRVKNDWKAKHDQVTRELEILTEQEKERLEAVRTSKAFHFPDLRAIAILVAESKCGLNVDKVLDREDDPESQEEISVAQAQHVVALAREKSRYTRDTFWQLVKEVAVDEFKSKRESLEQRKQDLEARRPVALSPDAARILPDDKRDTLARYESHLGRQFDKRLDQLLRLQSLRKG